MNRRRFLHRAALAGATTMAAPLEALARRLSVQAAAAAAGYGPLAPVRDETTGLPLLQLPEGFRYISGSWTGDEMEGGRVPGAHDGMAAFAGASAGQVRLVRNHEVQAGPAFAPALAYDPGGGGGTTTVDFDGRTGAWLQTRASLSGTVRNCAGGPTPWGSWLTCEETLIDGRAGAPFAQPHGYVFEVPADITIKAVPTPLTAMGRFVHEAVAIDPATGIVYETEDQRAAGLYRFVPRTPGTLANGGTLEMLAIAGRPRFDTHRQQPAGAEYRVRWVPIEAPDRAHESERALDGRGVFSQGLGRGGATFARLEGAWFGDGRLVVTATSGGNAEMGQVWELDPARESLRLVFESPGAEVLNMPDNICASPRGGLVLCEDGTANPCVHGLTRDGQLFRFARNNVRVTGETRGISGDFTASEFAGAAFSPDGQWLFVNIQSPGITFAITGPWEAGLI